MSEEYIKQENKELNDRGGFGWGLLGCCVPIVGLVLFLVWRDEKPRTAKAAGIGALVSVVASIVIYILYFVFAISLSTSIIGMANTLV